MSGSGVGGSKTFLRAQISKVLNAELRALWNERKKDKPDLTLNDHTTDVIALGLKHKDELE